jgi:SseB protein N-terminal domain
MSSLLDTLNNLVTDKTIVVHLYKQLFESEFIALVRKGTENTLSEMEFLTYYSDDGIRELPLFTDSKFVIKDLDPNSVEVKVGNQALWERLCDLIETSKCELAINPGQPHGIRINKEMIFGMISMYGIK